MKFIRITSLILNYLNFASGARKVIRINPDATQNQIEDYLNDFVISLSSEINEIVDMKINSDNFHEIPSTISKFTSLESIDFYNSPIKNIPNGFFSNFKNLRSLTLTISLNFEHSFEELLDIIRSNQKLESLILHVHDEKTEFIKCSNQIKKPENLKEFMIFADFQKLDDANFDSVLKGLEGLQRILLFSHTYCIDGNRFLKKLLNEKFEKIMFMSFKLNLDDDTLPVNESIKSILFSTNGLKTVPADFIKKIKNLENLEIILNMIESLPHEAFSNLKTLKISKNVAGLDKNTNNLTCGLNDDLIKTCFSKLKTLEKLDLSENDLSKIPNKIDEISPSIQWIDLSNNKLLCLPSCFKEASKQIQLLDLRGNQNSVFKNYDSENTDVVDFKELHEIYKNKLLPSIINPIDLSSVEKELKSQNLVWNFDYIRNAKNDPIPERTMNEGQLLELLDEIEIENMIDPNDKTVFVGIIKNLFKKIEDNPSEIQCSRDQAVRTLNLIEAIFKISRTKKTSEDQNEYKNYLSTCVKSIASVCIDGKTEELSTIYALISGNVNPDATLETFFIDFIARKKLECLKSIVTPPLVSEGVEVFLDWKYKLREYLGFDMDKPLYFGLIFSFDPYLDNLGNVLNDFYKKFTPEAIIDEVYSVLDKTERYNHLKNELFRFISEDERLDCSKKSELGVNDETYQYELTKGGIEYYLIANKIIFGDIKKYYNKKLIEEIGKDYEIEKENNKIERNQIREKEEKNGLGIFLVAILAILFIMGITILYVKKRDQ